MLLVFVAVKHKKCYTVDVVLEQKEEEQKHISAAKLGSSRANLPIT